MKDIAGVLLEDDLYQELVDAVAHADESTREERVARLVWLSKLPPSPAVVLGRFEQLHLHEEARVSFVGGQFAAVVLTAFALLEQTLVEELHLLGAKSVPRDLSKLLLLARASDVLSAEQLDCANQIRNRRNPWAHFKATEDEHSPVRRYRAAQVAPQAMLEEDARDAIRLAFEVFAQTMRPLK